MSWLGAHLSKLIPRKPCPPDTDLRDQLHRLIQLKEREVATLSELKQSIDGAVATVTAAVPAVATLVAEHAAFLAGTTVPPAVQSQIDSLQPSVQALTEASNALKAALTPPAA